MTVAETWLFLIAGYVVTVAIEVPILQLGLSSSHSRLDKLTYGLMLTAFTYPIVVLVLPVFLMGPFGRLTYIIVAETFAPLAEIAFFRFLTGQKLSSRPDRDAITILIANLCSFLLGAAFLSDFILQCVRAL